MKEFEFTLKYQLPDPEADPEIYIGQLLEAGCDDALIGIGELGRIALQFDREAECALKAVTSAMDDVKHAIPDAVFIEASPDLVGMTDMADVLGFSKQYMRKLILARRATFPLSFHAGKQNFWHLFTVLNWFQQQERREIPPSVIDVAEVNMQLNLLRESASVNPEIQARLTIH